MFAIALALANMGNDEQVSLGVMTGHDRNTLSLSGRIVGLRARNAAWAIQKWSQWRGG